MIKTKYEPCDKCKDGYIYVRAAKNGGHDEHVVRCQCLTDFIKKRTLEIRLGSSGLSSTIINYDLSNYIGEKSKDELRKIELFILEFGARFHNKYLYLYGPNGTQKTTLAQYVGRELLEQGFTVKYILMNDMIKNLTKEGFEENIDTEINSYQAVDCLIIDESFDKEKILWYKSGYQMNFLDTLLRKRIDQLNKSIIFISNKNVASINDNFNTSIYDLIKRNTKQTVLEFYDHYSLKDDFDPKDLWE